jgi:outer membrane protein assembly factor BamB
MGPYRFLSIIALLSGSVLSIHADDWPQYLGPKRDGVWRESGIVDKLPKEPNYLWRKPIGQGYAGPAVADGKVFVTDLVLNKEAKMPKSGFGTSQIPGKERVLCLDEKTGETLWKQEYECTYRVSYPGGPRCTPTVDGDRVYTLGTMGDLLCLNASTGEILWQRNFVDHTTGQEPIWWVLTHLALKNVGWVEDYRSHVPVWGFASHPLVDGKKLICIVGGAEGRGVVAFDKMTGREIWKALTIGGDFGYGVPVIYAIGKDGKRQLIIWHSKAVVGLDPDTGKRLWSEPWEIRAALTAIMPRLVDGNKLFMTGFYNGSMLLQIDGEKPEVVWKSTSKGNQEAVMPDKTVDLHSIMPTPVIKDGYIYGVCSYGELRCLKLNSQRVWATHEATTGKSTRWGNAFIVEHQDRYLLFNELGDLIICSLTPQKYAEISRMKLLEPTNVMAGRSVVWMFPAFANKNVYARNDKEIVCVSLAK